MTPIEMADWIRATDFYENINNHFINDAMDEVESMLRQQAEKIKIMEIWEQQHLARIAELEKDSKPAYWVLKTGHGTKFEEVKPYCEIDYWQPLYTTPQTKPLSDEEIEAISETIVWRGSDLLWELDFARAIEERILGK